MAWLGTEPLGLHLRNVRCNPLGSASSEAPGENFCEEKLGLCGCWANKWAAFSLENPAGWWFQIFFIFTPIWGRFPIWLIFFKWVETTNHMSSSFFWKTVVACFKIENEILPKWSGDYNVEIQMPWRQEATRIMKCHKGVAFGPLVTPVRFQELGYV